MRIFLIQILCFFSLHSALASNLGSFTVREITLGTNAVILELDISQPRETARFTIDLSGSRKSFLKVTPHSTTLGISKSFNITKAVSTTRDKLQHRIQNLRTFTGKDFELFVHELTQELSPLLEKKLNSKLRRGVLITKGLVSIIIGVAAGVLTGAFLYGATQSSGAGGLAAIFGLPTMVIAVFAVGIAIEIYQVLFLRNYNGITPWVRGSTRTSQCLRFL